MLRTSCLVITLALACSAQEGKDAKERKDAKELLFSGNLFSESHLGGLSAERDKGPGLGLNLEARLAFSPTEAFRLRWELPRRTTYGWEACFSSGYRETQRTRVWGVGIDYVLAFQPRNQDGFYLGGGLAFQHRTVSYQGVEADGSFRADQAYARGHLGLSAGVGYRFGKVSLELRAMDSAFLDRDVRMQGGRVVAWRDAENRGTTFHFLVGLR